MAKSPVRAMCPSAVSTHCSARASVWSWVVCFGLLPSAVPVWLFFLLSSLVYLCYGGGFGTMPATAADFFGPRNAGAIYGAMIVAWSAGGVLGPFAIAALADATGGFAAPFYLIAVMMLFSTLLPATLRKPAERTVPGAAVSAQS